MLMRGVYPKGQFDEWTVMADLDIDAAVPFRGEPQLREEMRHRGYWARTLNNLESIPF